MGPPGRYPTCRTRKSTHTISSRRIKSLVIIVSYAVSMETLIAADTHVHLYPCYDLLRAFSAAVANLARLADSGPRTSALPVLFLTERHDCHVFRALQSGQPTAGRALPGVRACDDEHSLFVETASGNGLYVIAGRQIVTAERIELLALATDKDFEDGLPLTQLIESVGRAGGIPVLSWAPGKWFFQRGRTVRELIGTHSPGSFFLGDSSLRPTLWPEPALMREGRAHGFRVIAGSDPLPFGGEEVRIGSYGTLMRGRFDAARPAQSMRATLRDPDTQLQRAGRRNGLLTLTTRLTRHRTARKRSPRNETG